MPWITRQTVVAAASPHVGTRIDRLVQELAGGTRSHVTGLFDHDCVTFNGQPMHEAGWRLAAGDRVEVRFEAGRRYAPRPKPRPHHGFVIVHVTGQPMRFDSRLPAEMVRFINQSQPAPNNFLRYF